MDNNLVSNKLYTGYAEIFIPVNKKYVFQHDGNSEIRDANGFILNNTGKSPGIINVVSTEGFWAMDFQDFDKTYTKADDTPMEVGIQQPPDIISRMREMIKAEVLSKYGPSSDEVETLEEALDFDIDGDGEVGFTAAEIAAMDDEQLVDMGLVRTAVPDELTTAPHDKQTGETVEPPPEPEPV